MADTTPTTPVIMGDKSLSAEDFSTNYIPKINAIADLIISHPDIPDDLNQADLLGALTIVTKELGNDLNGRVPEINRLQSENEKQKKQILKLQEMNQQFYLQLGTKTNNEQANAAPAEKPKKNWAQIKAEMESI